MRPSGLFQPGRVGLTQLTSSARAAKSFLTPSWEQLPQNVLRAAACSESDDRRRTRITPLPSSCRSQILRAARQMPPEFRPPPHPPAPPHHTPAPPDVPAAPPPLPPAPPGILCI